MESQTRGQCCLIQIHEAKFVKVKLRLLSVCEKILKLLNKQELITSEEGKIDTKYLKSVVTVEM